MDETKELKQTLGALENLIQGTEVLKNQMKDQLNELEVRIRDLKNENGYIVTENHKFQQEIHELLNEREYLNTAIDYYYDGD